MRLLKKRLFCAALLFLCVPVIGFAQMTVNSDGKVTMGNTASAANPGATQDLTTKSYVDTAIAASVNASGIVDSGNTATTWWVKYADGTMLEYGSGTTGTPTTGSNQFGSTSGSIFYVDAIVTFPVAFLSGTIPASAGSAAVTASAVSPVIPATNPHTSVTFRIYNNTTFTNITYRWFAVGRWK